MFSAGFWDHRYGATTRVWSGNPNVQLVATVSDLKPGTALDVGSGEGSDAIWLAQRGWQVTAVDISQVALDRAAQEAAAAGIEGISWRAADVLTWDPPRSGTTWCRRSTFTCPARRAWPCTGGWPRPS